MLDLAQANARVVRALAVEPDGTALLATRYVAPTPLPPHLHALAAGAAGGGGGPGGVGGVSATEAVMLKVRACGRGHVCGVHACVCTRERHRGGGALGGRHDQACTRTEVACARIRTQLARFVSLVPYMEDTAMDKRRTDMWATTAQVSGGEQYHGLWFISCRHALQGCCHILIINLSQIKRPTLLVNVETPKSTFCAHGSAFVLN